MQVISQKIGDRVLLAAISGTYIILGGINFSVQPEQGLDPSNMPALTTSGLIVSGSTDLQSSTRVRGNITVDNTAYLKATTVEGTLSISGNLNHKGSNIGFFNKTPTSKKTVYYAGSDTVVRDRLNSLIQRLGDYGLITPSN